MYTYTVTCIFAAILVVVLVVAIVLTVIVGAITIVPILDDINTYNI